MRGVQLCGACNLAGRAIVRGLQSCGACNRVGRANCVRSVERVEQVWLVKSIVLCLSPSCLFLTDA